MNNLNTMGGNTGNFNNLNNQFSRNTFPTYQNTSSPTNNIIWVQGIEGAKAYQLNPSSFAIMLDSEVEGKMYIKVSDNIGMSNLRIFNYKEEVPTANKVTSNEGLDLSNYVTKTELENVLKEIKEILANDKIISGTSTKPSGGTNTVPAQSKSSDSSFLAEF